MPRPVQPDPGALQDRRQGGARPAPERADAGSQLSISGLIARAGLDPQAHAGMIAWLALSAVVIVVTVLGMRRALAAAEPAWALSLNAFAALLISPISWTHHWVWAEPALLILAVLARRHSWRAGLAAVAAGLVIFAVSPAWLLPPGHDAGLWEQAAASSYVIFAAGVLLLSAFVSYRARPVLVNRDVHVPGSGPGNPGQRPPRQTTPPPATTPAPAPLRFLRIGCLHAFWSIDPA